MRYTDRTTRIETRIKGVETYITKGKSLRKTSEKLGIPHMTLWRWVKWYREGGKENLRRKKPYRRPWNRPSRDIEVEVALLKERNPALTLKKSQQMLHHKGINMSLKGIWGIWKRYALTGRPKNSPYSPFGAVTPEIKDALNRMNNMLKQGMLNKASKIVNPLPSFPNDKILEDIPEKLLTTRRQLERIFLCFGKISFSEYHKRVKKIRKKLEKKGLLYSSIFAALGELVALNWMMSPKKELEVINILKQRTNKIQSPSIRHLLSMHEGTIYSDILDGEKAKARIRTSIRLLRYLPYAFYFDSTGSLLGSITNYKKASVYFRKALEMERENIHRKLLLTKLSFTSAMAGRYRKSIKFLKDAEMEMEGTHSLFTIIQAHCALGQGNISKASYHIKIALEESEKRQLRNHLHAASLGLAGIRATLGEEKEAKVILRKYIPLFRKYGMKRETLIRNALLEKNLISKEHIKEFPIFKLLSLLRNNPSTGRYNKALRFAKEKELLGFLHRIIVFFPEPVRALLEKGKDTGLPRAILNLPVFRKEIPVYSVKFLGHLIIYKNQKYLSVMFTPKETSFLIFLSSSERKNISLERIYRNFWPNSKNPSRNLAHLLVRIRKTLRLPSHYLYVKENKLFFDCYFSTDYGKYSEHLAQANALLRAGEWGFAKREFMRAFKLFRGEPFRKMYDDWSDDKRLEVLFSYETEVIAFTKELMKRGRKAEAEKLLKKAERIVPLERE